MKKNSINRTATAIGMALAVAATALPAYAEHHEKAGAEDAANPCAAENPCKAEHPCGAENPCEAENPEAE